ncbi:type II toxin-antitoxin system HicB family antitoxin [Nitratireductor pacificus]|uniref:HicB-like antitoxin of toxin-antitoxin system domain-containing protein n=1 Tax=Nitratireductor pacificus pht-3B TaxID=391937 RepID=K2M8U4_9HYPH|nr:type II toxin-antitoxin system HicB family antitoxin [Nitratireductor pacificus]EKF17440.1 hypothetical protein NA2_18046 [Nitratireductor pacificus pht-3B]
MPHYIAIVHKDDSSAYGISFPDLPGCFSAADGEGEILPNAMEALELYFEDVSDHPAPKGIEEVRAMPQIAADLTSGAYLIAVPYRFNGGKSQRVNITLPKGLLRLIDEEAARRKMTRSAFIGQAAEREVLE